MRLLWTFFAGFGFACLALVVSAPLLGGMALVAWTARADLWTVLAGQSYFALKDDDGRMAGRIVNVAFHPLSVVLPNDPRPRRLLVRLEVTSTAFATTSAEGRVRLDAWPVDAALDLHKPPLYTLVVPGQGASLDAEGMLMVDRGNGRHTGYALASGAWLFDSDTPIATFAIDGEHRRFAALALADEEMPAGAVAVLAYVSPQAVLRRLLVRADDPARGRFLRGAVTMTRPVARLEDSHRRVLEIPFPAGTLRLAITGDDLDLAGAEVPAGLKLTEIRPWRGGQSPPVAQAPLTPSGATTAAPRSPTMPDRGH